MVTPCIALFHWYLIRYLWDCGTTVSGILTLSLISYILTVALRDCGGRHFHSFTNISYIDYRTAGLRWQAFSLFYSYLIYWLWDMRDCGGRHFHSFTRILYTDCWTAGLRWQACLVFHSYLIHWLWDCGGRHFCLSLIIHQLLDWGGTKAILIFHSHIYIMTTGPRTAGFRTQRFPSGPVL